MKLTNEMINKYADLVEYNSHGKVLEEIAKDFKLNNYVIVFNSINKIHSVEGHLSLDMHNVRERFRLEMREHLFKILSKEEFASMREFI